MGAIFQHALTCNSCCASINVLTRSPTTVPRYVPERHGTAPGSKKSNTPTQTEKEIERGTRNAALLIHTISFDKSSIWVVRRHSCSSTPPKLIQHHIFILNLNPHAGNPTINHCLPLPTSSMSVDITTMSQPTGLGLGKDVLSAPVVTIIEQKDDTPEDIDLDTTPPPTRRNASPSPSRAKRPRPVASPPLWDMNDRSFEDVRRPPLRKRPGPPPAPTAAEILEAKEGQLMEEEAAMRKELKGRLSGAEVELKLKEIFGERWKALQDEAEGVGR
ncbi:hypothetical protein BU24DRAFT_423450 [Aaosphaeria arxii CBS 175.79]|uniref:Uncharacterized protein n=1 Tax=Aaosphaeria arxii CBS 175.79 TaxID=1450172 RepID=A0A6A5XNL0_9PLEO|nr:uncharacterized protein BU24DRAFT_423450 [Aaosphaeria arxii CBS 175.79]KAF2014523.1 hypothetical protein BU24DRAFT_423450 [Aaosphaeria arxii CBS 175.79]